MNYDEKLAAYYRRVHGIEPGTAYDPDLHDGVPLMAFGPVPGEAGMVGPGRGLDPVEDLLDAAWAKGGQA